MILTSGVQKSTQLSDVRTHQKTKTKIIKVMKRLDSLGDRMKGYENHTCGISLIPRLPVIARLDGKAFSKFTKGLERPYDERMSGLMVKTTEHLVKHSNANCGYTQSDEITLCWYTEDIDSEIYFNGRLFKMIGELAATASVYFNRMLPFYLPEKSDKWPTFDCRVYNVPTLEEMANSFLWREQDATKNSISMAAQSVYSHKELMNKNSSEMQEMLWQKGINWNDYPGFFKRGTYVQRQRRLTKFSVEELANLPPKHAARQNPDLEIERWVVGPIDMPKLSSVVNRVDVIARGAEPLSESIEHASQTT